jgi:hypothetical protein
VILNLREDLLLLLDQSELKYRTKNYIKLIFFDLFDSGAGKSNFLEAILFGMGETLDGLRVNSLQNLRGKNSPDERTIVELHFRNADGQISIGSSIIDDHRQFIVNKIKVSKEK